MFSERTSLVAENWNALLQVIGVALACFAFDNNVPDRMRIEEWSAEFEGFAGPHQSAAMIIPNGGSCVRALKNEHDIRLRIQGKKVFVRLRDTC